MTEPRQRMLRRMRQYLLNQAREEDRVSIEDAYFADDEFFEELEAAETDLVDDYVRGKLESADRAAFEARCKSSSRLRERVTFARQIAESKIQTAPTMSWWAEAWYAVSRRPILATGVAVAILLLVTTIGWWAGPLRPGAGNRETVNSSVPAGPLSVQDARATQGAPAAASSAPVASPPRRALALVLLPSMVRAAGEAVTLAIGPEDRSVDVRLEHEGSVRTGYRAVIRTPEGKTAWEQAGLKAVGRGEPAVVVTVPVTALPAGDYIVTLESAETGRPTEVVAEYAFRAVRR